MFRCGRAPWDELHKPQLREAEATWWVARLEWLAPLFFVVGMFGKRDSKSRPCKRGDDDPGRGMRKQALGSRRKETREESSGPVGRRLTT